MLLPSEGTNHQLIEKLLDAPDGQRSGGGHGCSQQRASGARNVERRASLTRSAARTWHGPPRQYVDVDRRRDETEAETVAGKGSDQFKMLLVLLMALDSSTDTTVHSYRGGASLEWQHLQDKPEGQPMYPWEKHFSAPPTSDEAPLSTAEEHFQLAASTGPLASAADSSPHLLFQAPRPPPWHQRLTPRRPPVALRQPVACWGGLGRRNRAGQGSWTPRSKPISFPKSLTRRHSSD